MRTIVVTLSLLFTFQLHAQNAYQRGDLVHIKTKSSPSVLRVVAVPGDTLRADKNGIFVNGVAVTGFSERLISETPNIGPKLIPAKHYFVIGEEENRNGLSQDWSLHPESVLERAPSH